MRDRCRFGLRFHRHMGCFGLLYHPANKTKQQCSPLVYSRNLFWFLKLVFYQILNWFLREILKKIPKFVNLNSYFKMTYLYCKALVWDGSSLKLDFEV